MIEKKITEDFAVLAKSDGVAHGFRLNKSCSSIGTVYWFGLDERRNECIVTRRSGYLNQPIEARYSYYDDESGVTLVDTLLGRGETHTQAFNVAQLHLELWYRKMKQSRED